MSEKQPLEPVDINQCQAEKRSYHPFVMGGNPYRVERCKNAPTVVAVENRPGTDGQVGRMSLCTECIVEFEKQMGHGLRNPRADWGMGSMTDAYTEILARCPEVTWAMPENVPDHADLARNDPYLDAKLRCAARLYWLVRREMLRTASKLEPVHDKLEPTEKWIELEVKEFLDILQRGGQVQGEYDVAPHILRLLGISQAYLSSSARVERD